MPFLEPPTGSSADHSLFKQASNGAARTSPGTPREIPSAAKGQRENLLQVAIIKFAAQCSGEAAAVQRRSRRGLQHEHLLRAHAHFELRACRLAARRQLLSAPRSRGPGPRCGRSASARCRARRSLFGSPRVPPALRCSATSGWTSTCASRTPPNATNSRAGVAFAVEHRCDRRAGRWHADPQRRTTARLRPALAAAAARIGHRRGHAGGAMIVAPASSSRTTLR